MSNFEPYEGKEDDLQQHCVKWFRYQYPNVLGFHVPNGGKRNAREGAKFKRMGVLPGVPDFTIIAKRTITTLFNTKTYSGLFIELKTKTGKLSPAQRERIAHLEAEDFLVKVVRSVDEFIFVVEAYLD
jgi:hypothetical protein